MTTFSALVTRVSAELIDVPDRTEDQLETFVRQAIRKLQYRHDFNVCKTSTAVLQTSAGSHTLAAVPSDFLRFRKEPPHVIDNHGNLIDLGVSPSKQVAEREFGSTAGGEFSAAEIDGPPTCIAIDEPTDVLGTRNFLIYPLSDGRSLYTGAVAGEYRIRIPYIRQLPDLSDNQENWFSRNAEEYIVYAAVSIGFYFNHDEQRGQIWLQRAAAEVQDIIARDKNESIAGNTTLNVSFDALGPRTPTGDNAVYRGYF